MQANTLKTLEIALADKAAADDLSAQIAATAEKAELQAAADEAQEAADDAQDAADIAQAAADAEPENTELADAAAAAQAAADAAQDDADDALAAAEAASAGACSSALKVKMTLMLTDKAVADEVAAAISSGAALSLNAKRHIIIALASAEAGNDLINSIQAEASADIKL